MKLQQRFVFVVLLCLPSLLRAQAWSGILDPSRAIDWSTAGILGGIPARDKICANIAAATYGNGVSDATKGIQAALNACPSGQVVSLSAGTFLLNGGTLSVPSNVTLRGQGANLTVLNSIGKGGYVVVLGQGSGLQAPYLINSTAINGGTNAGSKSITVANASGISAGTFLLITELNDLTNKHVTIYGDEGNCSYCATWPDGFAGTRVAGQIDKVTAVNGTTLTLEQPLFNAYNESLPDWKPNSAYALAVAINPAAQPTHVYTQATNNKSNPFTCTSGPSAPVFPTNGGTVADGTCSWKDQGIGTTTKPLATYFPMQAQYAGVEDLQIYANNTGRSGNIKMGMCAYCWVSGVEGNYTDGDHVDLAWGYHDAVVNSYWSNAYLHTSGTDSDVLLDNFTTGSLIQNNILERLHSGVMLNGGSAGNVVAYNYAIGFFDAGYPLTSAEEFYMHSAHSEFNLWEGNIGTSTKADSIHGSNGYMTFFREWMQGAQKVCNPLSGRATVVCTPVGTHGSPGVNGWWGYTNSRRLELSALNSFSNVVGLILGSQDRLNLRYPETAVVYGVCGGSISTHCGTLSRVFGSAGFDMALGYSNSGDGGQPGGGSIAGYDSLLPVNTMFAHGVYSSADSTLTWASGVTHKLPASFYLPFKPAWFGSVPFPPIGPDVVGGSANSFGYAYSIPSEVCYESVMGGTDSRNSPLKFDANTCYGSGKSEGPAAPTNLATVVN